MGGYTIEVAEVQSAADALGTVASSATCADDDLTSVTALPAPAAGEGIGAALSAFINAWHDVLPKLDTEVDALSTKVRASAKVTVEVEEQVHNRFQAFGQ